MKRFSCWWINSSNNLPQIIESCDISQGALLISLTLALAGSASTQFIFHSLLSSGLLVAGSIYSKVQALSWPCWGLGQRECKEWNLFRPHFLFVLIQALFSSNSADALRFWEIQGRGRGGAFQFHLLLEILTSYLLQVYHPKIPPCCL